jgi:ribulose-5-phosphate 4-epimerase/fuculose-1-phosphate aldolase
MLDRRKFVRCAVAAVPLARVMFAQAPIEGSGTIDDLVAANRILASQGVFDAYGHVSMRNPANAQRYFMARSLAAELVTADDILEFDLDSNIAGAKKAAAFLERFIHGEIYKARPDVNSVIHCHTPSLIPFGATAVELRPVFSLAGFIAEGVPVFEIRNGFGMTDLLISDSARGRALVQTLGKKPVALMRGHGAVVVGPTVPIAVGRAVYLEINAREQMQAIALGGKVTYLDPEEGKQSVVEGYRRAWELWRGKALGK